MSKLDDIIEYKYGVVFHVMTSEDSIEQWTTLQPEVKNRIKALFISMLGENEQRETEDMSLKSWSAEDYKAFGKNELRSELTKAINEL